MKIKKDTMNIKENIADNVAYYCYKMADAMLKAREQ